MSDKQQPNHELLEEAIHAFKRMSVPERPLDAELFARLGIRQGGLPQPTGIPIPSKRSCHMHLVVCSTAAAVLLFGGLALFLLNRSSPEPVQVGAIASPDSLGDVAGQPPPGSKKSERLSLPPLTDRVAESQVIVVATGLDSAPAPPPTIPGDLPEVLIRFQVKGVLKGKLGYKLITTRTSTAAASLLGKDWIIFLSPDYLAGRSQSASCLAVEFEPTIKSILAKDKK